MFIVFLTLFVLIIRQCTTTVNRNYGDETANHQVPQESA